MLIEQLQNTTQLTKNEKCVAEYILAHLNDIEQMNSNQLAKASFTSKSTIVRLCQKLGLSGYQEFRLKLIAEINQKQRLDTLLATEPIQKQTKLNEITQIIPTLYDKAITDTKLSFKMNEMNRLLHDLKDADEIHLYATGIAYHLAQTAAFKFATLGYRCQAFESVNTHALARNKERKYVSFVISFTGANKSIYQIAQYLKNATNHRIVGILGPHLQQVASFCDEIIEIPNRDSALNLDVIRSACALNYVLDVLFGCLLTLDYDQHVAASLQNLPYNRHILTETYGMKE